MELSSLKRQAARPPMTARQSDLERKFTLCDSRWPGSTPSLGRS